MDALRIPLYIIYTLFIHGGGMPNWKEIVTKHIPDALSFFQSQGVKPTLRTLFYRLVSMNLIPNTKSSYKYLSRVLVKARQRGLFSWDFLEDRVRYSMDYFDDDYPTENDLNITKDLCGRKLRELNLEKLINGLFYVTFSKRVGFWARQPYIVEVWVEKDALAETLKNWLSDLAITIRVNRGYPSWTFIHDNVQSLRNKLEYHQKVVVLYCGDLDPSGKDIDRFIQEALDFFDMSGYVEFIRAAVTPKQVERYNLPPKPEDAETLLKLKRDSRYRKYNYDYIVELDALVSYVPRQFRESLRSLVLKYHDERIHKHAKGEARELYKKGKEIVKEYKRKALEKLMSLIKDKLK